MDLNKSHSYKVSFTYYLPEGNPASRNLVFAIDKEELEAQRQFYDEVEEKMAAKRAKKLESGRRVSLVFLPLLALSFVSFFWVVGLIKTLQDFPGSLGNYLFHNSIEYQLLYI